MHISATRHAVTVFMFFPPMLPLHRLSQRSVSRERLLLISIYLLNCKEIYIY
jgi:hypothetical protein